MCDEDTPAQYEDLPADDVAVGDPARVTEEI